MQRIIFHVDVNNAFLSWQAVEMLKNGSTLDIRTIPAVIGGDEQKRRGVVVAKSYPAKKLGITTGEPIYLARRKAPDLYVVQSNRDKYKEYSDKLYNLLCKYSPVIERYSIDECFMDMTGMELMYKDPVKLAYQIKDEVEKTFGFTVNVGVANCKVCAKMASDFEKPNKVHTLFDYEVKEKMWPLKVDDLFMVGKSSSDKLHKLGINTIGDLAKVDVNLLTKYFKSQAKMMHDYANGIDDSKVERPVPKNKGIGHSTTLPYDLTTIAEIKAVLRKLSDMVGIRLRKEGKLATVIYVQLKNSSFISYGHQKKLINPVSSNEDIYEVACDLAKSSWKGDPIRLVGLRVSDLTDKAYEQMSLFEEAGKIEKRDKVQKAVDEINSKFGSNTIKSASLFKKLEK